MSRHGCAEVGKVIRQCLGMAALKWVKLLTNDSRMGAEEGEVIG